MSAVRKPSSPSSSSSSSYSSWSSARQRKRTMLSLETKYHIIERIEFDPKLRPKLTKEYALSSSTVSGIVNASRKIIDEYLRKHAAKCGAIRIEEPLLEWCDAQRRLNNRITHSAIIEKAIQLAATLRTTLHFTDAWIHQFVARNCVPISRSSSCRLDHDHHHHRMQAEDSILISLEPTNLPIKNDSNNNVICAQEEKEETEEEEEEEEEYSNDEKVFESKNSNDQISFSVSSSSSIVAAAEETTAPSSIANRNKRFRIDDIINDDDDQDDDVCEEVTNNSNLEEDDEEEAEEEEEEEQIMAEEDDDEEEVEEKSLSSNGEDKSSSSSSTLPPSIFDAMKAIDLVVRFYELDDLVRPTETINCAINQIKADLDRLFWTGYYRTAAARVIPEDDQKRIVQ